MNYYVTLIVVLTMGLVYGQNSPGQYTVKNAKINTQSSDFGTAFFGKDKVVFASPKQGFTLNREENTSQPFLDLYIGEVTEDGQIIKKQKLPGDINSKYHEGMVSFTKDMKTVYFSANNYVKNKKNRKKNKSTNYLQLFKASVTEDGEWTNLTLLPFNGVKFSSGHPVLNKDDSQLYFVSDRPESIGKTDLFVVDIYKDGSYSQPRNLGPQINTTEREMFPFIGTDNVLYFSSDGYQGHGELDVYASKIFDTTVSEPINLEEPVNSEHDDFAYIIDDEKSRGYFSSNREGGHGDDDIYSFLASPPIYIECKQEITGVVRDIETRNFVPDVLIVLYDAKGLELESFISSKDEGSFSFQQSCNTTYKIKGYLEGYVVGEMDIKTVNDLNSDPIQITLELKSDLNNKAQLIADLDSVEEAGQIDTAPEEKTTAFAATSDINKPVEQQKNNGLKENTTVIRATDPENEAVAAAVPLMKSVTEAPSDETKMPKTTANPTEALSSVVEDDPEIESSTSIAMVSNSSVETVVKEQDEKFNKQNAVIEMDSKKDNSAGLAGNSVKDSGLDTETVDEVLITDTVNQQKEVSTTAVDNDGEQNSQQVIAMDMSDDNSASSGTPGDFQSKTSSDETIHINTIYFDYDKYDIRFDAKIELEKIAVVLKENPDTKIKVNAHTDIRGKKTYNLKLSKNRAYSTVQYLVNKGIEEERISSEGHGETQVAEKCTQGKPCTGLQHQLNRRSEFLIVDKFSDAVIAQSMNKMVSGNYVVNDRVPNSGTYVNYDFSSGRQVYTVQIGAFRGNVQTDKYSKLTNLFNYRYNDGLNRYYAGIFESSSEARNYMKKIKKQGFGDAFVVGLKGENRF